MIYFSHILRLFFWTGEMSHLIAVFSTSPGRGAPKAGGTWSIKEARGGEESRRGGSSCCSSSPGPTTGGGAEEERAGGSETAGAAETEAAATGGSQETSTTAAAAAAASTNEGKYTEDQSADVNSSKCFWSWHHLVLLLSFHPHRSGASSRPVL